MNAPQMTHLGRRLCIAAFERRAVTRTIPFSLMTGLAPTGLVSAGRPQEFVNVRLHQTESNIPVKLLAPFV
jgi:hypothetical protein